MPSMRRAHPPAVRARPECSSIPFIFLTARTDQEHRLRAQELGVADYITKPVEIADLLATVREQLERAGRMADKSILGE